MKQINQTTRRAFFAAAVVLSCAAPAMALPIPVGSTAADDLIINFNFLSSTPPPPYSSVGTSFTFAGVSAGETLIVDIFGGLNGTNFISSSTYPGPGPIGYSFFTINAALIDGLYSYGFRLTAGAADLDAFEATGTNAGGTASIVGTPVSAVPEPASLTLFGLCLGAVAARRRARQNATNPSALLFVRGGNDAQQADKLR